MVVANQLDIYVANKSEKKAVVVNVTIPRDGNIRKKEQETLEKFQRLKEELERISGVKASVVPVVMGALWAVIRKLRDWLQEIPGIILEIVVQMSAVQTAWILPRALSLPGLW